MDTCTFSIPFSIQRIQRISFSLVSTLILLTWRIWWAPNNVDRGSTVVKVLCYKSEGRWFDPSCCYCYWHKSFPIALWPWGRLNLWQKWVPGFSGGKGGRCVKLIVLPPPCAVVMKSGNISFLEHSGPLQACNGTTLRNNASNWQIGLNSAFKGLILTVFFVYMCFLRCYRLNLDSKFSSLPYVGRLVPISLHDFAV